MSLRISAFTYFTQFFSLHLECHSTTCQPLHKSILAQMAHKLTLAAFCLAACAVNGEAIEENSASYHKRARNLLSRRADRKSEPSNGGCTCSGSSCECCEKIESKKIIKFDEDACLEATYNSSALELDLELKLNGDSVWTDEVGISDLTKLCFGVPLLSKLAEACVEFNDVVINTSYVGAEVDLDVEVLNVDVLSVDLGHIHFTP